MNIGGGVLYAGYTLHAALPPCLVNATAVVNERGPLSALLLCQCTDRCIGAGPAASTDLAAGRTEASRTPCPSLWKRKLAVG